MPPLPAKGSLMPPLGQQVSPPLGHFMQPFAKNSWLVPCGALGLCGISAILPSIQMKEKSDICRAPQLLSGMKSLDFRSPVDVVLNSSLAQFPHLQSDVIFY